MQTRLAKIYKEIIFSTSVFVLCLSSIQVKGAEEKKPQLCQGNYQTEQEAKEQLARFAKTYSTLEQWKARAEHIREGILRGAELSPLPKKCPLKPIIHSKRRYDGYTVENAAFESLPGVFVTGNLYRPLESNGPFAGILCPHGHFSSPGNYGRFRPGGLEKRRLGARQAEGPEIAVVE